MGDQASTLYVILTTNAASYRAAMKSAGRDTRAFGDDVDDTGRRVDRLGNEIDSMSGRLGILVDALALVGPATVPIGAVAIPTIGGLANVTAISVSAIATLIAAFQGMGDTLEALNDYRLDPTAANLEAVEEQLSGLAPAAREFALEAYELLPVLEQIQRRTAQNYFAEANAGFGDALNLLPRVSGLMAELADVSGELTAQGLDDLDSRRTRDFIRFLKGEARPALQTAYDVAANLTAGLGELWMAFDPLNDDVAKGLVDASETFRSWAEGLDGSDDFEAFIDYVRTEGPEVKETLLAIADAGIQITQAIAPLGGPALDGLELVADAIATIADSPLGTPLLQGFAALTLLNRSMAITAGLMTKAGLTSPTGGRVAGTTSGVIGVISSQSSAASASVRQLRADVRAMSQEYRRSSSGVYRAQPSLFSGGMFGSPTEFSRTQSRIGALRSTTMAYFSGTTAAAQRTRAAVAQASRTVGRAGPGMLALGAISTGTSDKLGLTNTASLALAGSFAGPYGAAVGGAIGLTMDLAAANRTAAESTADLNQQIEDAGLNFEARNNAIQAAKERARQMSADVTTEAGEGFMEGLRNAVDPDVWVDWTRNAWGLESLPDEARSAADEAELQAQRIQGAFTNLAVELGNTSIDASGIMSFADPDQTMVPSMRDLDRTVQQVQPALDELGYTMEKIESLSPEGLRQMNAEVLAYMRHADSAQGRTENLASAIADMRNDALSTADSASQLAAALDDLLGPELSAEEATDAWRVSLRTLRKELHEGAGFEGYRKNAIENREVTRAYANTAIERLTALAGVSTTTEKDMAAAVGATRREFIASGIEAGISRKEIERRANALGLTPKLVRTVFRAAGITKTELQARRLREAYDVLPKDVRTHLRAEGIPQTQEQVDQLVEKYKLTGQERRAVVTLKDLASPELQRVLEQLGLVDRTNANPTVTVGGGALGVLGGISVGLSNLNGRTANIYVNTIRRQVGPAYKAEQNANGGLYVAGRRFADGGFAGNGSYHARVPQIVKGGANILWGEEETGWEAYVSGKPSQRSHNIGVLGEAARRFGLGLVPRQHHGSGGGQTVVIKQVMPNRMQLVVGGRVFDAHVRAVASDVSRGHIESARSSDDALGRMDWDG